MNMKKRSFEYSPRSASRGGAAVLLAGVAVLAACVGSLPRIFPAQAERAARWWPGTTSVDLDRGRSLYATKCSACHTLRLPSQYPPQRWPAIMDSMQRSAGLSNDSKELILRYLLTASDGIPSK